MSRKSWSLSALLGRRLVAMMLATLLLAAGTMAWRTLATVRELDDSALQSQAQLIARNLPGDPATAPRLPDELLLQFQVSDGDNVFLVYRGDALVTSSDEAAARRLEPTLRRPLTPGYFRLPPTPDHDNGMLGLVALSGPWKIVVLQGREQTSALLDSLLDDFLYGAIPLLLAIGTAMVGATVLTLRRGLRVLHRISDAARAIGPETPSVRLPEDELPREIAPLVSAMNDALARLDHALGEERRFIAEAAHALRTPLAVMTARLDDLEGPQLEELKRDAERLTRLVGQLLSIARIDAQLPGQRAVVDLQDVAVEVVAALAPLGLRMGVEIGLTGSPEPMTVHGNRAALALALTNLVENALSYAPAGTAVDVVLRAPASIVVLDRGPGVPDDERDRIFRRFHRGPNAHPGGAGIGLAIVAQIAAEHGGTASVEHRPGGGAAFVLSLPARSAALVSPDRTGIHA